MNHNIYLSFFITLHCFLFLLLTSMAFILSLKNGHHGITLPILGGGDDSQFYFRQAINISLGNPAILTSSHALIQGWILWFFQTDEVYILRLFNYIGNVLVLISGLAILFILNKNIMSGIVYTLLLSIYPSYLLISNLSIIRDTWIIFYYLFSVFSFLMIIQMKDLSLKIIFFIILLTSLFLLFSYRDYALLSFVLSSIVFWISFLYKNRTKSFLSKKYSIYIIIGFSIVYSFFRSFKFPIVDLSLNDILVYRDSGIELYGGGSQMYISLNQSNVITFFFNYIYSVVSNAIGPLPWQFTGTSTIILFFSETIVLIFIAIQIFTLRKGLSPYDYFLIINSIIWFMLIGIFNDNIGAAARLRLVGWILLFIVYAKLSVRNKLVNHKNLR